MQTFHVTVFGVRFKSRPSSKSIFVEYDHTKVGGLEEHQLLQEFEILHILEFSSQRRRMSVVVKTPEDVYTILISLQSLMWILSWDVK